MAVGKCEICEKRTARYVCQECGREVCELCLEPHTHVCVDCYSRLRPEAPVLGGPPWSTPIKLFILGFLVVFIGMMLLMTAAVFFDASTAGTGVVIWIFPLLPIVVGTGPHASWAVVFALVLAILGLALIVFWRKRP